MTKAGIAYFGVVFVMSLVTFVIYGFDKRRAGDGGRRMPERTLHILAFFGGCPGALLAQQQYHHKTRKTSFLIVFWMMVVLHVVLVGAVAYAIYGTPFTEAGSSPRPINK